MAAPKIVSADGSILSQEEFQVATKIANLMSFNNYGVFQHDDQASGIHVEYHSSSNTAYVSGGADYVWMNLYAPFKFTEITLVNENFNVITPSSGTGSYLQSDGTTYKTEYQSDYATLIADYRVSNADSTFFSSNRGLVSQYDSTSKGLITQKSVVIGKESLTWDFPNMDCIGFDQNNISVGFSYGNGNPYAFSRTYSVPPNTTVIGSRVITRTTVYGNYPQFRFTGSGLHLKYLSDQTIQALKDGFSVDGTTLLNELKTGSLPQLWIEDIFTRAGKEYPKYPLTSAGNQVGAVDVVAEPGRSKDAATKGVTLIGITPISQVISSGDIGCFDGITNTSNAGSQGYNPTVSLNVYGTAIFSVDWAARKITFKKWKPLKDAAGNVIDLKNVPIPIGASVDKDNIPGNFLISYYGIHWPDVRKAITARNKDMTSGTFAYSSKILYALMQAIGAIK